MPKQSDSINAQAIRLAEEEITAWEGAEVQITDRISFDMRSLLKTNRKNYYGVFDNNNGEMVWVPITERAVEDALKNFDLDTKDVRQYAKRSGGGRSARVIEQIVKEELYKMEFGKNFDMWQRNLAIDGTAVVKVWSEGGEPKVRSVDLLNVYIDPNAESLHTANSFIERVIMDIDDFKRLPGMIDTDDIEGAKNVPQYRNDGSTMNHKTPKVEIYERYGLVPAKWLDSKDKSGKWVESRMVWSGTGSRMKLHYLGKWNKRRPYEEMWYTRVPNRWYGRGVAEKVIQLQLWANMTKNIHITRQKMAQLGVFKVRTGSGLTPQMLRGLKVNGVLQVKSMDDIEQMVLQEASPAHYRDMDDINEWVNSITSAVTAISPETLPSAMPATTAVINDRNNRSMFTLIREGIGYFVNSLIDKQLKPIIAKKWKQGDYVRIIPDESTQEIINRMAASNVKIAKDKFRQETGAVPTYEDVQRGFVVEAQRLRRQDSVFLNITAKELEEFMETETRTVVTNEEVDSAVQAQNLISMLSMIPDQMKMSLLPSIFDRLGLEMPREMIQPNQPVTAPQQSAPIKPASSLDEAEQTVTGVGVV